MRPLIFVLDYYSLARFQLIYDLLISANDKKETFGHFLWKYQRSTTTVYQYIRFILNLGTQGLALDKMHDLLDTLLTVALQNLDTSEEKHELSVSKMRKDIISARELTDSVLQKILPNNKNKTSEHLRIAYTDFKKIIYSLVDRYNISCTNADVVENTF